MPVLNPTIQEDMEDLYNHLVQQYYKQNINSADLEAGSKVMYKITERSVVFEKSEDVLLSACHGSLRDIKPTRTSVDLENYVDLTLKVYLLEFLIKDSKKSSIQKEASFFDRNHNQNPYDDFLFASFLAYLYSSIEQELLLCKEFLLRQPNADMFIVTEIEIAASLTQAVLNQSTCMSNIFNGKDCKLTTVDMINGRWRRNKFVQNLMYGRTYERLQDIKTYPVRKVFISIEKQLAV